MDVNHLLVGPKEALEFRHFMECEPQKSSSLKKKNVTESKPVTILPYPLLQHKDASKTISMVQGQGLTSPRATGISLAPTLKFNMVSSQTRVELPFNTSLVLSAPSRLEVPISSSSGVVSSGSDVAVAATGTCVLCKQLGLVQDISSGCHKFPSSPDLCREWRKICRLDPNTNINEMTICSRHFKPEEYNNTGGMLSLKPEAIPTTNFIYQRVYKMPLNFIPLSGQTMVKNASTTININEMNNVAERHIPPKRFWFHTLEGKGIPTMSRKQTPGVISLKIGESISGSEMCVICREILPSDSWDTLHPFPEELHLQRLWKLLCNINDKHDVTHLKLCSKHFHRADFWKNPRTNVRSLKFGSVPTINIPNPLTKVNSKKVALVGNKNPEFCKSPQNDKASQYETNKRSICSAKLENPSLTKTFLAEQKELSTNKTIFLTEQKELSSTKVQKDYKKSKGPSLTKSLIEEKNSHLETSNMRMYTKKNAINSTVLKIQGNFLNERSKMLPVLQLEATRSKPDLFNEAQHPSPAQFHMQGLTETCSKKPAHSIVEALPKKPLAEKNSQSEILYDGIPIKPSYVLIKQLSTKELKKYLKKTDLEIFLRKVEKNKKKLAKEKTDKDNTCNICCLCGFSQMEGQHQVTLHKFPECPEVCVEWRKACGLKDNEDVSKLRVCSSHFEHYSKPISESPVLKNHLPISIPLNTRALRVSEENKPEEEFCPSNLLEVMVCESNEQLHFEKEESPEINIKTGRSCYLCNFEEETGKISSIVLHPFPTNRKVCQFWKGVCNLFDHDYMNTSSLSICSKHFVEEDFIGGRSEHGGPIVLKSGAVPSVFVPNPINLALTTSTKEEFIKTYNAKKPEESLESENECTSTRVVREDLSINAITLETPKRCLDSSPIKPFLNSNMNQLTVSEVITKDSKQHVSENCTSSLKLLQTGYKSDSTDPKDDARALQRITCVLIPVLPEKVGSTSTQTLTQHLSTNKKISSDDRVSANGSKEKGLHSEVKTKSKEKEEDLLNLQRCPEACRLLMQEDEISFEGLLSHLQKMHLLSKDACDTIMNDVSENSQNFISKKLKSEMDRKSHVIITTFALTLQMYSIEAYNYVSKLWPNLIPGIKELKPRFTVPNGLPGFCQEVLNAISLKKGTLCNIVISEMPIRQQVIFENKKFFGRVDLGVCPEKQNDNIIEAQNVLIFFASALNQSWQVPVAYFFIRSLNGKERANLLVKCLELLKDASAEVMSITIDGSPMHVSMCTHLGANFSYGKVKFQPWFQDPVSQRKIYIFWDACHMIKLVRDTLGDNGHLLNFRGKCIKWSHIEQLYKLQSEQPWSFDTKLTEKHIYYHNYRSDFRFCLQTFSKSVFKGLSSLKNKEFMPTAEFCFMLNEIFDILNSVPNQNFSFLSTDLWHFVKYIHNLQDSDSCSILEGSRRTGFLGLIISLKNIMELNDDFKTKYSGKLHCRKLSLDYARMFWQSIMHKRNNDLPNAKEFIEFFQKIILKKESKSKTNDLFVNSLYILRLQSLKENFMNPICNYQDVRNINMLDCASFRNVSALKGIIDDVFNYVCGIVISKILMRKICSTCAWHLSVLPRTVLALLLNKKERTYLRASEDVCKICKIADRVFHENKTFKGHLQNINFFVVETLNQICWPIFDTEEMNLHVARQTILDNHKIQLCKLVIETYLNLKVEESYFNLYLGTKNLSENSNTLKNLNYF